MLGGPRQSLPPRLRGSDAPPRLRGAVEQIAPEELEGADHPFAESKLLTVGQVRKSVGQGSVEVVVGDPPVAVKVAENHLVQCAANPVKITGPPDRLFEGHSLQSGKGVDRDKGFQWVVSGHHPRRHRDIAAQPRALVICVCHDRAPIDCAGETWPALSAAV